MSAETTPTIIYILEKEYRIACTEEEKGDLIASTHYLNAKMKDLRDSGKVAGTERIAVMAALNIAHEFLQHRARKEEYNKFINTRVRVLQEKLEAALLQDKQPEF